ncbi:MAG: hypothetical protein JRD92_04395 [Deltaproteobacteria bacterium]|nr:hypothetical protein [Deltaproteobacteria bacterium]
MRRILLSMVILGVLGCGAESPSTETRLPEPGDIRFGTLNEDQVRRMVEIDPADDGPFYMVNLIKFREKADYADGRETDLTGREADALYAPLEFLAAIGAQIVFVADVEANLISLEGTQWEQIAIVRYPSRALFFQMTQDEEFQARAIHKDAGVEKTLVMVTHLRAPITLPEGGDIPNPATEDDPPVAIAHLLAYNEIADYGPDSSEPERTGREAMSLYEQAGSGVAIEQGGGPLGWFDVEGVFIGDEREWDEFRINLFPSHAAFAAVVADPTRQAGQVHREAAIEDTYTTANQVFVNGLSEDGSGGGLPEVTDNGTGTLCATDATCEGQEADFCLSFEGAGFCTVTGCGAGTCEGDYLCCHDCADFAADLLPFEGSACLPSFAIAQVSAAQCTCD